VLERAAGAGRRRAADERAAIAEAVRARDLPALLDRATRGYSRPRARPLPSVPVRGGPLRLVRARAGRRPARRRELRPLSRATCRRRLRPADLGAAG
jgi:hypothetical protein